MKYKGWHGSLDRILADDSLGDKVRSKTSLARSLARLPRGRTSGHDFKAGDSARGRAVETAGS